jgi:dihydrolipoamide dehydrogenase
MLAHKASKEAEVVAEVIAGHKAEFDVRVIPAVIFSDPEVASAGITADEAKQRGREVKVGKFPFSVLGRAIANADTDGFVKVVIDAASKECSASTSSATAPPTSSPRPRWRSRWGRWRTTSA